MSADKLFLQNATIVSNCDNLAIKPRTTEQGRCYINISINNGKHFEL